MSLNLNDLGLVEVVREIVEDLNSGYLVVVRPDNPESENPYVMAETVPQIVGYYPLIGFKDGTTRSRYEFGQEESGLYRCTIALNQDEIFIGDYLFLDWGQETKVIPGIVSQIENRLSSLVYITLDSKESVPFEWSEIKQQIANS